MTLSSVWSIVSKIIDISLDDEQGSEDDEIITDDCPTKAEALAAIEEKSESVLSSIEDSYEENKSIDLFESDNDEQPEENVAELNFEENAEETDVAGTVIEETTKDMIVISNTDKPIKLEVTIVNNSTGAESQDTSDAETNAKENDE